MLIFVITAATIPIVTTIVLIIVISISMTVVIIIVMIIRLLLSGGSNSRMSRSLVPSNDSAYFGATMLHFLVRPRGVDHERPPPRWWHLLPFWIDLLVIFLTTMRAPKTT